MKRVLLFLALAACHAPVGVNNVDVPKDSAPRCGALCSEIGLPLDSVVIMANNVGCVCRAANSPLPPPTAAPQSASAGGMAAIMLAQQAEESRRRNAAASQRR